MADPRDERTADDPTHAPPARMLPTGGDEPQVEIESNGERMPTPDTSGEELRAAADRHPAEQVGHDRKATEQTGSNDTREAHTGQG